MNPNEDKCHFLKKKHSFQRIDNEQIDNSECEKILGIKADCNLNFLDHPNRVLKKATCKVNILSRIVHYMSTSKRKSS